MKPHLRFSCGLWWIGPVDTEDFFLWACCAPTVREACGLWRRCLPTDAAADSAATT